MIIKANKKVEIQHPRQGTITGKVKKTFNTDHDGFAHIWMSDHEELVVYIPMCTFTVKED